MALDFEKLVKLAQIATFKEESDKAYVAQEEGKTLTSNDYTAEDKAKVGTALQPDALEAYTTTSDLQRDYLKQEELEGKLSESGYATESAIKAEIDQTYAKKDDVPKVQIPTCTKNDLEEKKATAVDGDRVVVTDDEYHIYIYVGETGTGEWKDTGTHIKLEDYVTNTAADEKYAKKEDVPTITVATDDDIRALFAKV